MSWTQLNGVVCATHAFEATQPGCISVDAGEPVRLLGIQGEWVLVQSESRSALGLVPASALSVREPRERVGVVSPSTSPPALSDVGGKTGEPAHPGTAEDATIVLKMERVGRSWRTNLRRLLSGRGRDGYDKLKNQISQLGEWRRQKMLVERGGAGSAPSSSRVASAVNERILHLIESSSQQREGLVTPRTDADEPAWEGNTGVMQLLRMHMESEARLLRGVRLPVTASQALSDEVARGLHGGGAAVGAAVHNSEANDITGVWAAAAAEAEAEAEAAACSPLQQVAEELAMHVARVPPPAVVQLLVDVDTAVGMAQWYSNSNSNSSSGAAATLDPETSSNSGSSGGAAAGGGVNQPVDILLAVYDASAASFLSTHSCIALGADGMPADAAPSTSRYGAGRGRQGPNSSSNSSSTSSGSVSGSGSGSGGSSMWSQAFFVNVPRDLVIAGKCYLVFRMFRRGPLKEKDAEADGSSGAGGNVGGSGGGGGGGGGGQPSLADVSSRASFAASISDLLSHTSKKDGAQWYSRPVGVGVLQVPPALCRLADGTPHRSGDGLSFMRPARNEDARFAGLHRILVAERDRDVEQEGRRRATAAPANASAAASAASGSGAGGAGGEGSTGGAESGGGAATASSPGGKATDEPLDSPGNTNNGSNSGNSGATSGGTAMSRLVASTASFPISRCSQLQPFPVVIRCFSGLAIPTLRDPRFQHLFAGVVRSGRCVMPAQWSWRPAGSGSSGSTSGGGGGGASAGAGGAGSSSDSSSSLVPSAGGRRLSPAPALGRLSRRVSSSGGGGGGADGGSSASVTAAAAAASAAARTASPTRLDSRQQRALQLAIESGQLADDDDLTVPLLPGAGTSGAGARGGSAAAAAAATGIASGNSTSTTANSNTSAGNAGTASSSASDGSGGAGGAGGSGGAGGNANGSSTGASAAAAAPVELLAPSLAGLESLPPSLAADAAVAHRELLHPDVLLVTLRQGFFLQEKVTAARNVQVRVVACLDNGSRLPCLLRAVPAASRDSGNNASSSSSSSSNTGSDGGAGGVEAEYRSAVYYHVNSPQYDETLAIRIPSHTQFQRTHLLLTFWQASSKLVKTHCFAFAVLPLADVTGQALRDGRHVLRCYKPVQGLPGVTSVAGGTTSAETATLPYYLIAPIVDTNGKPVLPAAPVPFVHLHHQHQQQQPQQPASATDTAAATAVHKLSNVAEALDGEEEEEEEGEEEAAAEGAAAPAATTTTATTNSSNGPSSGDSPAPPPVNAFMTTAHIASARNRHLPVTAVPVPLSISHGHGHGGHGHGHGGSVRSLSSSGGGNGDGSTTANHAGALLPTVGGGAGGGTVNSSRSLSTVSSGGGGSGSQNGGRGGALRRGSSTPGSLYIDTASSSSSLSPTSASVGSTSAAAAASNIGSSSLSIATAGGGGGGALSASFIAGARLGKATSSATNGITSGGNSSRGAVRSFFSARNGSNTTAGSTGLSGTSSGGYGLLREDSATGMGTGAVDWGTSATPATTPVTASISSGLGARVRGLTGVSARDLLLLSSSSASSSSNSGSNDGSSGDAGPEIPYALELRKDVFEVETLLLSGVKASSKELHSLSRWRLLSQASLLSTLQQLHVITADPHKCLQVLPKLLSCLADILSAYNPPEPGTSSGTEGHGGHGDGHGDGHGSGHGSGHGHGRTSLNSAVLGTKILAAAVSLLLSVLDRVCATLRPAQHEAVAGSGVGTGGSAGAGAAGAGAGGGLSLGSAAGADGEYGAAGGNADTAPRPPRMAPPAVDTFAAAHALDTFLLHSFAAPSLHRVLMPLLLALLRAPLADCAAASTSSGAHVHAHAPGLAALAASYSLSFSLGPGPEHSYSVVASQASVLRAFRCADLLLRICITSFIQDLGQCYNTPSSTASSGSGTGGGSGVTVEAVVSAAELLSHFRLQALALLSTCVSIIATPLHHPHASASSAAATAATAAAAAGNSSWMLLPKTACLRHLPMLCHLLSTATAGAGIVSGSGSGNGAGGSPTAAAASATGAATATSASVTGASGVGGGASGSGSGAILTPAEVGDVLAAALAAVPLSHWSYSPSTATASAGEAAAAARTPRSLRISLLLMLRSILTLRLLDLGSSNTATTGNSNGSASVSASASVSSRLAAPITHVLLHCMNADSTQRAMCIRITAALLARYEREAAAAATGGGGGGGGGAPLPQRTGTGRRPVAPGAATPLSKQPVSPECWYLSLLLYELSLAVSGVVAGHAAPGEVGSRAGGATGGAGGAGGFQGFQGFQPPDVRAVWAAAQDAGLIPPGTAPGAAAATASATAATSANSAAAASHPHPHKPLTHVAEVARAFEHVYARGSHEGDATTAAARALEDDCACLPAVVYEELFGPSTTATATAAGSGGAPARGGSGGSSSTQAKAAAEAREHFKRLAVTTWMSLVWAIPEAAGPLLLATVAPLRHVAPLLQPGAFPLADALQPCLTRLRLCLCLLHTCMLLLGAPCIPASWLSLAMLQHNAVMKLHRWVAGLLASAYRGTHADDEAEAHASTGTGTSASGTAMTLLSWLPAAPVWSVFVDLTLALLTSPLFAPEVLKPSRRQAVLELYGDRRHALAALLRWTLGGALAAGSGGPADARSGSRSSAAAAVSSSSSPLAPAPLILPPAAYLDHTGKRMTSADATAAFAGDSSDISNAGDAVAGVGEGVVDGVCLSLRLHLAPALVAPLLDLTHCVNRDVAALARDLYMDLIRAELQYQALKSSSSSAVSLGSPLPFSLSSPTASAATASAATADNNSADAVSGLPLIERLTIDAIDVLVANKGPSLVVPRDATASGAASGAAGAGKHRDRDRDRSGNATSGASRLRNAHVNGLLLAGAASGASRSSDALRLQPSGNSSGGGAGAGAAAAAAAATGTGGGGSGGGGVKPLYTQYVPPSDNLIMSLFAPSRLRASITSASGGHGGHGGGGRTGGDLAAQVAKARSPFALTLAWTPPRHTGSAHNAANSSSGSSKRVALPPVSLDASTTSNTTTSSDADAAPSTPAAAAAASTAAVAAALLKRQLAEGGPGGAVTAAAASSAEEAGPGAGSSAGGASGNSADYQALLSNRVVVKFLSEIRTLYAMLSSVSKYPHTADFEEERSAAALTLIRYLRRTHRHDMYCKYVTMLLELHASLKNSAEAALAWLLHADILNWDDRAVLPGVRTGDRDLFPPQTAAERLELVLRRAMDDLIAAQCWEEAVRVGEVLARRYEYATLQYGKLGALMRQLAGLYEDIVRKPRLHPQYFVVAYAGPGFPRTVRDRVFVYRGGPSERIADFEERVMRKWPGALKAPLRLRPTSSATTAAQHGQHRRQHHDNGDAGDVEEAGHYEDGEEEEDLDLEDQAGGEGHGQGEGYGHGHGGQEGDGSGLMELSYAAVTVIPHIPAHPIGYPLPTATAAAAAAAAARQQQAAHSSNSSSSSSSGGAGGGLASPRAPAPLLQLPPTPTPAQSASAAGPLTSPNAAAAAAAAAAVAIPRTPASVPRSFGDALHGDGALSSGPLSPLAYAASPAAKWAAAAAVPQTAPVAAAPVNPLLLHSGVGVTASEAADADAAAATSTATTAVAAAAAPAPPAPPPVPPNIRQGQTHAGARYFLHQRPFRKRADKTGNEFLDMWVSRCYVATADAFPTTHRRSRVVSVQEVILNPVEAALLAMREKNAMLCDLIERAAAGPDRCAEQAFTQALQGVVDAAVSGGVANYRAFFNGSYRDSHPEIAADLAAHDGMKAGLIEELGRVLVEQLRIAARGIRVHGVKCAASLLPLHGFLCGRFEAMRAMLEGWGLPVTEARR